MPLQGYLERPEFRCLPSATFPISMRPQMQPSCGTTVFIIILVAPWPSGPLPQLLQSSGVGMLSLTRFTMNGSDIHHKTIPTTCTRHLCWKGTSPYMVMRYLSTLQQEDAVRINQEVRFDYTD